MYWNTHIQRLLFVQQPTRTVWRDCYPSFTSLLSPRYLGGSIKTVLPTFRFFTGREYEEMGQVLTIRDHTLQNSGQTIRPVLQRRHTSVHWCRQNEQIRIKFLQYGRHTGECVFATYWTYEQLYTIANGEKAAPGSVARDRVHMDIVHIKPERAYFADIWDYLRWLPVAPEFSAGRSALFLLICLVLNNVDAKTDILAEDSTGQYVTGTLWEALATDWNRKPIFRPEFSDRPLERIFPHLRSWVTPTNDFINPLRRWICPPWRILKPPCLRGKAPTLMTNPL